MCLATMLPDNGMQRTRATAPLSSTSGWRSPLMPGVRCLPCGIREQRCREFVVNYQKA
jgi:hypothetical protein